MDDEFMIFVVLLTLISGGLFLIFTKMILNHFKERRQGKGASLGTSELEAMMQRVVEASTASLHDRLDDLEQQLDEKESARKAVPKSLPAAQPRAVMEDLGVPAEAAEVPQPRRSDR